jgi:hypothetical protein
MSKKNIASLSVNERVRSYHSIGAEFPSVGKGRGVEAHAFFMRPVIRRVPVSKH